MIIWSVEMKISWISPWISRIDWCEGKECIFRVFRPFLSLCRTASRPYRLSNIISLCINQSYQSKDQSMKFSWKILRIGDFEKWVFFWVGHFDFFLLHFHEIKSKFIGYQEWVEILMITLVSSCFLPWANILHPSV